MLRPTAAGVLVHQSDFLQTNAIAVQGPTGVLLIDPGVRRDELACLANDLAGSGQKVVAGFSTHPHFDHVLWDAQLGSPPRYGTARCAADLQELLSDTGWRDRVAEVLPPDIADQIPMDLFGLISGLPPDAVSVPWDGPHVRIIEHQAHATGHAALLIEEPGVLAAGDMLSDVLMPFLDLEAVDPIEDYLAALRLFEAVAGEVDLVVPGHGSVGRADELRRRIDQDRAYVEAVRDGVDPADARLDPSSPDGDWLPGVHRWQVQHLTQERDGARNLR